MKVPVNGCSCVAKGFRWRRGSAVAPYLLMQLLHGPRSRSAFAPQLQLQAAMPADQTSSTVSQWISQKVAGDVSINDCRCIREGCYKVQGPALAPEYLWRPPEGLKAPAALSHGLHCLAAPDLDTQWLSGLQHMLMRQCTYNRICPAHTQSCIQRCVSTYLDMTCPSSALRLLKSLAMALILSAMP